MFPVLYYDEIAVVNLLTLDIVSFYDERAVVQEDCDPRDSLQRTITAQTYQYKYQSKPKSKSKEI